MKAIFYSFKKRINSTKIVNVQGTEVEFVYKSRTERDNPIIEIATWNDAWNYVKIDNRYFFINSVEHVANRLYRVTLTIDLLATYKSDILSTNARVLYSANNFSLDIIDERIISSGNNLIGTQYVDMPGFDTTGKFFMTTLNTIDGEQFTTTYALSSEELAKVVKKLNEETLIDSIINSKWWDNALETIVELYWLPIKLGEFGYAEGLNVLSLGDYTTGIAAAKMPFETSNYHAKSVTIDIPWQYNDFRNLEPYTSINLYLPGIGLVSFSSSDVYKTSQIFIHYMIDTFSGNIVYEVRNSHENVIAVYSGNLKVSLPVGGAQPRVGSLVSLTTGGIASVAMLASGHVASGIATGAYTVAHASNQRQYVMNGGFSGSTLPSQFFSNKKIYLWVVSKETYVTPTNLTEIAGSPCGRVLKLSDCVGFTKTAEASVSTTAHKVEIDKINSYLNGGVYIE